MLYEIISFENSKNVNWNEFEILIKDSWRRIQKNLKVYTPDYEFNRKIWGYENTLDSLKNGNKLILVFDNELLIGTVTISEKEHKNKRSLCITKFAVKEEYRGNQVGEKIINFCKEIGKKEGYSWLTLFTSGLLENLVVYYEKMGFQRYKIECVSQFGIEYNRFFLIKVFSNRKNSIN